MFIYAARAESTIPSQKSVSHPIRISSLGVMICGLIFNTFSYAPPTLEGERKEISEISQSHYMYREHVGVLITLNCV